MPIFKNRPLNIAILISTSCHFIFIFSITPILGYGNIKRNFTKVSFLGAILEDVVSIPEKTFSLDVLQDRYIKESFSLSSPEVGPKLITMQPDKEKFIFKSIDTAFKLYPQKKHKPMIALKNILDWRSC